MKRVAEHQLTKDSDAGDEDEPPVNNTGVQKADPSVLGTRKIRGLPRRSLASSATPDSSGPSLRGAHPPNEATENMQIAKVQESTSRFGSFVGFGEKGTAAHAFSFSVPSSNSPQSQSTIVPTSSSAFPATSSSAFPSSLASFAQPTPPKTPPLTFDSHNIQDAALAYYMALRGINSSFLDAAVKAFHADPFVDISQMLEKYQSFRMAAQKDFDAHRPPLLAKEAPQTIASTSQIIAPKVSAFTSPSSSPAPATDGPFSFTNPKPDSSGTPQGFSLFKPTFTTPSPAMTPSNVNQVSGQTSSQAQSPQLSFGEKAKSVAGDLSSGKEPPLPVPVKLDGALSSFKPSATATPFTPGLSSFLPAPKPGASSSSSTTTTTGESFTFFSPPNPGGGTQNASPPSPSTFGFGSGKNFGFSGSFGSFSKGSIGNPVGFGFGSASSVKSSGGSGGGVSGAKTELAASGENLQAESASKADDAQPDGSSSANQLGGVVHEVSPAPSLGSVYDVDGPGEEDENTIHETKARAYKLIHTGEKKDWVAVGTGQLKLKARNEHAKFRILMRNSSTGQVILNFNLFPAFRISVDKTVIMFSVPGEDDSAAQYRLRVPTEADALKWQQTISQEINNLVPSSKT